MCRSEVNEWKNAGDASLDFVYVSASAMKVIKFSIV